VYRQLLPQHDPLPPLLLSLPLLQHFRSTTEHQLSTEHNPWTVPLAAAFAQPLIPASTTEYQVST
jgi:hypothetical protein